MADPSTSKESSIPDAKSIFALSTLSSLGGTISQKWSASSGPQITSNISASLPDSFRARVSTASNRFFDPTNFRSPKIYLGVGEERAFYVETNPSLLLSRVKHNLSFFYLNYALITVILFALTLMISPSSLISIAVLALMWVYSMKITENGYLLFNRIHISNRQTVFFMSAVTIVCLLYVLSSVFWWTCFSSAFCIFGHGVGRDASMHKDQEDHVEMSGDLEEAPFLNAEEEHV